MTNMIKKTFTISLMILVLAGLFLMTRPLNTRISRESINIIEQSIRRGAVQCYALEGAYPENLEYLEQHYGVTYDHKHYIVDYTYLASNLMPDITVLPVS